jgi:Zn-dependent alcohol dehydrogenase
MRLSLSYCLLETMTGAVKRQVHTVRVSKPLEPWTVSMLKTRPAVALSAKIRKRRTVVCETDQTLIEGSIPESRKQQTVVYV